MSGPSQMQQEALETPVMIRREAAPWEAQAKTIRERGTRRSNVALIGLGSSGHACTFIAYLMML